MSTPSRIEGDTYIAGALSCQTLTIPSGTVLNAAVGAGADIDASKLEHQYQKVWADESDTTASAQDHVIHVVYGTAGTVVAFECGNVVANLVDATITVDLHNNGASILTAAIELDNGDAAYAVVGGTIDTATLADGDVLEVVITVAAGGGTLGKGVFASCIIREDAA